MSPYKDPVKQKEKNREYQKGHYQRNKDYYKQKAKERKIVIQRQFTEYKNNLVCEVCGEGRSYCLDFHHTNPKEKEHDVASMPRQGFSWKNILKEIRKCQVTCKNCHAEIHFNL